MFWGIIGPYRVGELVEVEKTMNRLDYIEILEENLCTSIESIYGDDQHPFVLVQDNAPPHSARDTQNYLFDEGIQTMQWPPHSPDMNIIETVWGYIIRKLRRNPPATVNGLRNRVHQLWNEITPEYLQQLYDEIPTRVRELHRVRGYPTKY
jgi:hypothetical protein